MAAGAVGAARLLDEDDAHAELVPWEGPRQAGIVTPRTPYGMVAAFDVVTDDLETLFQDLTARIAEVTQGQPDRLDPISNAALPPSDTGELGFEDRDDGRLTITLALGASLFDDRFGLAGRRPPALSRMPSFPGDNLDRGRCHGDLLLLVQSDHAMITHHALRDVMRRTKGRLEGRWAQSCFQRFAEDNPSTRKREGVADARGLLGFPDGSQNIGVDRHELIFAGEEVPEWARGGSYLARAPDPAEDGALGPALAHRPGATRSAARRSPGAPLEGRREEEVPKLDERTPIDAHIRMANPRRPGDERHRFLRRPFVYANGFDDYGLLDSGSVFLAFCRDIERQFATIKRRTHGQDLDEYMVAFGGGYFFCPPGVDGEDDYLARAPGRAGLAPGRQRAPVGRVRVVSGVGAHGALRTRARRSRRSSRRRCPDSNGVVGEEAPVGRPGHVLGRDRPAPAHAPQALAVRVHHVQVALADERDLGPVRRPGRGEAALARQPAASRPVRLDRRELAAHAAARSPASSR